MALAYWQYDSMSPVPCWVSGLAKRALLADSSGTAAAVIEAGCLVAAQNAEHAVSGRLTGTNQPAIAQIGRLAAFEQAVELVATLQQQLALIGLSCKRLQACTVGTEVKTAKQLAAYLAVLVEQRQQRQFFREDTLQAREVAVAEGLEFGVDQFKQLLGGADIVGEQFKQLGVVHCRLFGVTGTDASSIQRLLGDQLPQCSPVTSAGIRN